MTVVCFTQKYNPASLFQSECLQVCLRCVLLRRARPFQHGRGCPQELQDDGTLSFCDVKRVDVDRNRKACVADGVSSTPALMLYYGNSRLAVERPGSGRSDKCALHPAVFLVSGSFSCSPPF